MSVRELRAALRKDEAALKRSQQLVAEKEKQLQQLSQQLVEGVPESQEDVPSLAPEHWIRLTLEGVGGAAEIRAPAAGTQSGELC